MTLAPAYVLSGQEKKARAAAVKLLELNPKFSVAHYEKRSLIRKKEDLDRIVTIMRKTGLPDLEFGHNWENKPLPYSIGFF